MAITTYGHNYLWRDLVEDLALLHRRIEDRVECEEVRRARPRDVDLFG